MASQDLRMTQGEAITLRVVVVDAAGAPADLTGLTLAWALSAPWASVPTLLLAAAAITLATTEGPNDTAVITLAPADTAGLVGVFRHELAITGASAALLCAGGVVIDPSQVL